MNTGNKLIQYAFTLKDQRQASYDLTISEDGTLHPDCFPSTSPDWAKLEFCQCPHCPITTKTSEHCPTALALNIIGEEWSGVSSYEAIQVEINLQTRKVSANTSAQVALGSLVGLLMGASQCPHLSFFRPLARNHLPLATPEETSFRVLENLLAFCRLYEEDPIDFNRQLEKIYDNLEILNRNITQRIKSVEKENVTTQAIIQLDCLAKLVPAAIEESKDKLLGYFSTYQTTI
ncbi:MAG: hypothetical protein OEX19_04975 [Gammaproteobacteria bacterium]|nr:hypothetical protein [Gammaproteobacteria bacterium]